MSSSRFRVSVLLSLLILTATGMHFDELNFYIESQKEAKKGPEGLFGKDVKDRLCGRFVMHNLMNAGLRFPSEDVSKLSAACRYASDIPSLSVPINLADQLGFKVGRWSYPNLPTNIDEVKQALGGYPHFFVYKWRDSKNKWHAHAGKLFPNGDYAAFSDDGVDPKTHMGSWLWLWNTLWALQVPEVKFYRVCDDNGVVNRCNYPKDFWSADSTIGGDSDDQFTVRHQWVCCWKEKLPGEAPWSSRTTPYACLNWTENRGTTWDTLISPRANMAGCTSVVFIQSCTTNLLHGSNKTIEIRGSTDDGATWPYLIGTDTTKKADIDWAAGQRNVRIAWIYKGR
ncbi:MAG: hypothetical protein ABIK44_07690, partial [candidate division WOR-3 bacterium]